MRSNLICTSLTLLLLFLALTLQAGAFSEGSSVGTLTDSREGKAQLDRFSFVQLCDTQLGMGGYEDDLKSFRLAVEQINALQPDFVIICGDLINKTDDDKAFEDFNTIKEGFAMPCYCVPGNHDVGNDAQPERILRYNRLVYKDYYTIRHKGYAFLFANTSLWINDIPKYSQAHQEWFTQTLQQAHRDQQSCFVVSHYPPFIKSAKEPGEYFNLPPKKRMEILHLATQYGVKAFLSGHLHRNNITQYKGIPVVSSATTSKNFDGAPRGFRLWHIQPDGTLQHEYRPIKNAPPNPKK